MSFSPLTHVAAAGLNGATSAAIDTTGASLLVMVVAYGAAPTISDSKGNTWFGLTAQVNTGMSVRIYYAFNATVGAGHTFTVAATSGAVSFEAASFSGALLTDPFDVQQGGTAATTTVAGVGAGTLTPSAASSLVVTAVAHNTVISAFAAQAGFTTSDQQAFSGGVSYGSALGYLVQTTAAPISAATATSSWTTASNVAVASAVFKVAVGGGSLTSGTATLSSATNTTINVSVGAASGGTGPYTYQWYRSATANFTPGAGNLLAGATSITLADSASLVADTPYYYVCRSTDNVAATVDSNQIAGALKAAAVKWGFIGDSITFGYGLSAGQDPVSQLTTILKKTYKNRDVTLTNSAVSGSKTSQWVTGQAYLTTAKAAFAAASVTHVHIMLGANDAAASNLVTAATYKTNLQNIIADLTGAGYKVILSYPTYIPAGANSGGTTAAGVALAQAYQAQIDSLIDGTTVYKGDTLAFNYFMDNIGEYQADLTHPTATGAIALATLWARASDRYVLDASGGALIPNSLYYGTGRLRRSASGATIPSAGRLKIG